MLGTTATSKSATSGRTSARNPVKVTCSAMPSVVARRRHSSRWSGWKSWGVSPTMTKWQRWRSALRSRVSASLAASNISM